MSLDKAKCIPCSGKEPPLNSDVIHEYLDQIDDRWKHRTNPDRLIAETSFPDFMSVVNFVNVIAKIAEAEEHHPNLRLHDYNKLEIEIYTHKINGLHKNDFILASKIDKRLKTKE